MKFSSTVSGKPIFALSLDSVSQCVVPVNNRDELEIQFLDAGKGDQHRDNLVQITLHFAAADEEDESTQAEALQNQIMSMGVLSSLTGDIIVEFTKEQGNFVTPRGKYGIQVRTVQHWVTHSEHSYQ
jgi:structure-specific recognition protein 1